MQTMSLLLYQDINFATACPFSMAVTNLQFLNLKLFSDQQQKGVRVEQQWNGMQMKAVVAAAATKESALNEERTALEARLQGNTAACAALETKVIAMTLIHAFPFGQAVEGKLIFLAEQPLKGALLS